MSTDPTAGTTGQAAPDPALVESVACFVAEDRARRWRYDETLDGPALAEFIARQAADPNTLADVTAALFAGPQYLAEENARLRQERNEAREVLGAETAKRERLGMALSHLRTDMSLLADRVRDAVAASSPLSATETAPQTVPGVTGHTEPSTAPSAPAGGHWHVGRSWSGTDLEDTCPCPKEPCGLVDLTRAVPECTEHPAARAKSMRQVHAASECPGNPPPSGEGAALIADTEKETSAMWLSSGVPDLAAVTDMRGAWRETAQTLARKVDERDTLEREWRADMEQYQAVKAERDNLRIALAETRSTAMRKIAAAEEKARGIDMSPYADRLRALTQPTTQPAASDAHIGRNGCDCDPITGCPVGGHDA